MTNSAYDFPSEAWTSAYKDAVNGNAKYREAGKAWTFGPVAMIIQKDESKGIAEDVGMILDVHEGQCRGTKYIRGLEAAEQGSFVIVGTYERWKQVIQKELEPIKGMMQGKLKLTKGHLPTMIRFVDASRELVESASNVPTQFAD